MQCSFSILGFSPATSKNRAAQPCPFSSNATLVAEWVGSFGRKERLLSVFIAVEAHLTGTRGH